MIFIFDSLITFVISNLSILFAWNLVARPLATYQLTVFFFFCKLQIQVYTDIFGFNPVSLATQITTKLHPMIHTHFDYITRLYTRPNRSLRSCPPGFPRGLMRL